MDEMEKELERLKCRQGIIEGRFRDLLRMRKRMADIFRLHEKDVENLPAKETP